MTGSFGVTEAVICAAGLGRRLCARLKPLVEICGTPLLKCVIERCFAAGIERVTLVTGHRAEELRAAAESWELSDRIGFAYNPDFRGCNGLSLFRGADACSSDFALLMADHLFEPGNLTGLLERGLAGACAVLAVDKKLDEVFDLDDATKVREHDGRVAAIGKDLADYNAVDTGMFLLSRDAVLHARGTIPQGADPSISAVMRCFIAAEAMAAHDVGKGRWQDVDTPAMLREAERLMQTGRI